MESKQFSEIKLNATGKTLKDRISLFVSKTIDYLGYSYEMIKYRQRMYHVNDELTAQKLPPETRVTTGGKGEGTTMYFENDTDYIFVVKQVMCTDFPVVFMGIKNLT
ncbi:hypothetical protein DPMN_089056 [Dreissena polymorpha]|uniref:Uncharacterized protein n=1 Tax=Dreissena polymorpha TaxID=45954 RepID=A0A9D4QWZ5_DREPO|nr:hypothetical protein DPMN_089056 [Dreissena polymorpha]